jgi:hypothetical protein
MILAALGWIAAIGLLAACLSSARHGLHDKKYGPWTGAGLYACAAVVLLAAVGALSPAAAAVLAFLTLITAAGLAVTEALNPADGQEVAAGWRLAAARGAYGHAGAGFGYLARDTRGLAGWLKGRRQERAGKLPDPGPAASAAWPASPVTTFKPDPNGASTMPPRNASGNGTRPPANGTVQQPAIRARRLAAQAGSVPVPAGWAAVVAGTADFEAGSNVELAQWMTEQVLGLAAWAEAIVEQHEANRAKGVDAAAISMLHDVADAGVASAGAMAGAVSQFCNYFELPDAFVDEGKTLAHSGDWHQGSPG